MQIEKEIVKICEEVVYELDGIQHNYTDSTEVNTDNGIDSLALMNILIEIEKRFGINLDEVMLEICEAKRIADIIKCVEKMG